MVQLTVNDEIVTRSTSFYVQTENDFSYISDFILLLIYQLEFFFRLKLELLTQFTV